MIPIYDLSNEALLHRFAEFCAIEGVCGDPAQFELFKAEVLSRMGEQKAPSKAVPYCKRFVLAVMDLPEALRDIVATGLMEFIRNPGSWGCVEDGVYAYELFSALDAYDLTRMKLEFNPVSNPKIYVNALEWYLNFVQDYLGENAAG